MGCRRTTANQTGEEVVALCKGALVPPLLLPTLVQLVEMCSTWVEVCWMARLGPGVQKQKHH